MREDNYLEIIKKGKSKKPINYLILSCTYHSGNGNIREYNGSIEYPIVGIAEGKIRRGEYTGLNVIVVDKKILENEKNCFGCNYLKIEPIGTNNGKINGNTNNGKINRNTKIKLDPYCKALTQEGLKEIKRKLYEEYEWFNERNKRKS